MTNNCIVYIGQSKEAARSSSSNQGQLTNEKSLFTLLIRRLHDDVDSGMKLQLVEIFKVLLTTETAEGEVRIHIGQIVGIHIG